MSHRVPIAFAVTALLAVPAIAFADTSGGAAAPLARAPVAQVAASPPSSSPTPSSPGRERTGIVNVSSKVHTTHRHAASKPTAKSTPKPTTPAPAPVAVPHYTARVAGGDGLPYTGGSPILGALCGVAFLLLGVGVRLRYGFSFRLAAR